MKKLLSILIGSMFFLTLSCKKGWLEARSDKSQVIPTELKDYQALLDNSQLMNYNESAQAFPVPALLELGADSYITPDAFAMGRPEIERNCYIWARNVFNNNRVLDWQNTYKTVYYANLAIDGMNKITRTALNGTEWDNCMGSGLFYRSIGFFNIAQVFARPYDKNGASTDMGIPLRLDPDPLIPSTRATIKQTYDRIITDLQNALPLLPDATSIKTRPSKAAAHAMLSRTYLVMGEYEKALESANASLAIYSTLIDYNLINAALSPTFSKVNDEILFFNAFQVYAIFYTTSSLTRPKVNPTVYANYTTNDLRKTIFFNNTSNGAFFKGYYSGITGGFFSGLATDELYLNKAECLARLNQKENALVILNEFLKHRYSSATYSPYIASNANEVLVKVLDERRKQLIFRGMRWVDLRRLNKETQFAVTLKRTLSGVEYTLPPNDPRYTYPIPEDVIQLTGMPQNIR